MVEDKRFCTFYLDGLFFGVEVVKVQEVLRFQEMTRVPLAANSVSGLINLRGQIVTAIDLRKKLNLKPRPSNQFPMNIVIRLDDGVLSFLVDEIGDVVEVDPSTFEHSPETVEASTRDLIRGVYKLKERLLLILDTDKVLDMAVN